MPAKRFPQTPKTSPVVVPVCKGLVMARALHIVYQGSIEASDPQELKARTDLAWKCCTPTSTKLFHSHETSTDDASTQRTGLLAVPCILVISEAALASNLIRPLIFKHLERHSARCKCSCETNGPNGWRPAEHG